MMENVTERFVNRLYAMAHSELPPEIKATVRECYTDYLSVVLAGSGRYMSADMDFIETNRFEGKCHIFGSNSVTDMRTAILVNAFNAHVLELDDSHRVAMTHLGAPVFSALTGVAEVYGKTADDVMKAAVTGYEAAVRLANAVQPGHKMRGFHVSGTCCTAGCAMAIAAMLDYSLEEMKNVFSAAVTSSAGLLAVISGSSEQKPYNVANAAEAGTNAALFGKYFTGAVDILGDSRGFFHAMTDVYREEKLFEEGYAIGTIYQKLYAACRHCHAPMEAMTAIGCGPEKIDSIDVMVYDLAIKGHDHTEIQGVSSAKQSIPYAVAVACVRKDCGPDAFTEEAVNDKAVLGLAKKVSVKEDPELTAMVPGKRAARVEVHFTDGTAAVKQVDYAKGEPENPITHEEMVQKFRSLTRSAGIGTAQSEELLDLVQNRSYEPVTKIFDILETEK